ncbi:Protein ripply2, partial [Ophiophagus hannah]
MPKDCVCKRLRNFNHSVDLYFLLQLHSPSEATEDSVKLAQYTHPVRLFWPKSKCFDYMYHEAEALLRNFPVQATIFFYDESEDEEDSDGTDHESGAEQK